MTMVDGGSLVCVCVYIYPFLKLWDVQQSCFHLTKNKIKKNPKKKTKTKTAVQSGLSVQQPLAKEQWTCYTPVNGENLPSLP